MNTSKHFQQVSVINNKKYTSSKFSYSMLDCSGQKDECIN